MAARKEEGGHMAWHMFRNGSHSVPQRVETDNATVPRRGSEQMPCCQSTRKEPGEDYHRQSCCRPYCHHRRRAIHLGKYDRRLLDLPMELLQVAPNHHRTRLATGDQDLMEIPTQFEGTALIDHLYSRHNSRVKEL